MIIFQALPEHRKIQGLSIVHIALGWIIAQHAVDHDFFFSLIEPTILPAKPRRCLSRRWRKVESAQNTDQSSQRPFNGEKPMIER